MAINKVINKSSKSHGAMRNVLEYVLQEKKVKDGLAFVSGPYPEDTISYDKIYQCWLKEKRLWNKDTGRMYAHNIISFHKDEKVSPAGVFDIGNTFAEKFFSGYQYVVTVHQDKNHLHCHIVTNSVSYLDGIKLHQTKRDLERQKQFTNNLCLKHGLTIALKGHHFNGTPFEQGEITAWNKNKYNLFLNDSKKSYVLDCAIAITKVIPKSANREDFIILMKRSGWIVHWDDKRKHIVFENESGKKVRDSNLEKTFAGLEVNKEALTHEFERQNELRLAKLKDDRDRTADELKQYYAEIESATAGLDSAKTIRDDTEAVRRNTASLQNNSELAVPDRHNHSRIRTDEEAWQTLGYREDTEALIREVETDISDSRSQSRAIISTENQSVAHEKQSITDAEQRRLEEQRRVIEQKRARATKKRMSRSQRLDR